MKNKDELVFRISCCGLVVTFRPRLDMPSSTEITISARDIDDKEKHSY